MDIAEIGFRADTADLLKAVNALDKVKTASAGVSSAASRTASVIEGAATRVSSAKVAMARADQAEATAALKRLQISKQSTSEELAAARALQAKTKLALADAVAEQRRSKALMESAAAQRSSTAANRIAFGGGASVGMGATVANGPRPVEPAPIPRDMMPNRFNTANLAAQFQDIGVTAAMGMNPLQIALQQGTQLSAILNSMESPLKGLAVALKSVFNAVSLGTIAFVAIIAALLQFVNWTQVAKTVLNALADAIQLTLPYIAALAAGLALIYSRTIIAGIASVITSIVTLGATALATGAKMAAAWVIGLGPIGWIAAAVVALGLVFQAFGTDVLGYVKTAVNGIVGAFIGAFNSIKVTWKTLPAVMGDIVIATANIVLKKIGDMINGFISMVNGMLENLPDWAKPDGGKITWQADLQIDNPFEGQAAAAGKSAAEEFKKAMNVDYVGKANDAVQGAADAIAENIRNYASHIGDKKNKKKDPWEELVKGAERHIATSKAEAAAVGLSEQAAAKLKYQTELLNEAQQKNIKLTAEQRTKIDELAEGMASAEINAQRVKEAFEFGKDVVKGFFQDMKQGLQEGKSLWESFGSAVTNVLNKIVDKMMDASIDTLFGGSGAGFNSGAGLLGNLISSAGFNPGLNSAISDSIAANPSFFAKGGAFTNSVVTGATPFAFAGGGAFGVMGEAGAEAVMPLHRGPDGSLGVKLSGGGAGGGGDTIVAVNVNNYGNSKVKTEQRQTSNGMEIDVIIDQAVASNISRQGSETNRSLNTFNNRQLISR